MYDCTDILILKILFKNLNTLVDTGESVFKPDRKDMKIWCTSALIAPKSEKRQSLVADHCHGQVLLLKGCAVTWYVATESPKIYVKMRVGWNCKKNVISLKMVVSTHWIS